MFQSILSKIALTASTPGNVGITSDMLDGLVDGISSNVSVIMPVAIGLFTIIAGIGLLPKIISKVSGVKK